MNHVRTLSTTVAIGALLAVGTVACGSDDPAPASDSITVTDAWSRRPVDGQTTGAVYGTLDNDGDTSVTAVAASSDVSEQVELHEVVMNDDGTMTMRERDGGYEIPAGGSITLEPGGLHVMLLDVDPSTYPDVVALTLEFDDGSTIELEAEVRDVDDAMAGMDMDMDHDDSSMDDGSMDGGDDGMTDTDDSMDDSMDDMESDEG